MVELTPNAISQYYKHDIPSGTIVQVLETKRIPTKADGPERFRLVISDGVHYQQAMLTTGLNHLVTQPGNQAIEDFCFLRIGEAMSNEVGPRTIIVIMSCDVIGKASQPKGSPTNIVDAEASGGRPMMPPNQPHQPANPWAQSAPAGPPDFMRNQPAGALGGPVAAVNSGPMSYHPINSLNPYQQRWTIKARVTAKSDIRTWSNQKGEGKLFTVDLLDAQGGQIRCTMFNDACDKFNELFQIDRVYVVSKGQLKVANKKFSRINNDYEITLNADAEVTMIGDDVTIQQQRFDFVPIEALRQKEENDFCDVIGVVTGFSSITQIVAKATNREIKKRSITIADTSLLNIELTLWGETAEKYNEQMLDQNPVIAVKNVKVSNFGGKQLSASFQSQIFINPERPETRQLIDWWQSQGCNAQMVSLTERSSMGGGGGGGSIDDPRVPLSVIRDGKLGFSDKPDYITVRATLATVRGGDDMTKPPWYLACPNCQKKVNVDSFCEKCNTSAPEPNPRYLLSLMLADHSFTTWATAFSEQGQMILNKPAVDLFRIHEMQDEELYRSVFDNARFTQWIVKLKIKAEQSQQDQEQKARCSVIAAQPLDFIKESRLLLDEIQRYPAAGAAVNGMNGGGEHQHQAYQSGNYY